MNIFHTTTPSLDNKIHLKMFYIASKTEIPPIRAVLYCETDIVRKIHKSLWNTTFSVFIRIKIRNYQLSEIYTDCTGKILTENDKYILTSLTKIRFMHKESVSIPWPIKGLSILTLQTQLHCMFAIIFCAHSRWICN